MTTLDPFELLAPFMPYIYAGLTLIALAFAKTIADAWRGK